jgi:tetratricopeptide (TPR) repeat protein
LLAAAAWVALAFSPPALAEGVGESRDAAFNAAVDALASGDPAGAARSAWTVLDGLNRDDKRYDRAARLLAVSAEQLGLRYPASLLYLDIAEAKRDPDLVPDALRGLERIVMGGPHDEDTLVAGFLASAEHPNLPPEIQPFIDYLQGLDNARQGLDVWAAARFARLPTASPYAARAAYVRAVQLVAARKLPEASAAFDALLERDDLPADVATDARRSLARLAFEAGRYDDALARYEAIRDRAPDDPALILEMAWTQFHRGDSRRALGLLMALDAPIYADLIAPERFVLEALSLRRLCQFDAARIAAVRLRTQYGEALRDLEAGVRPIASVPLRKAARRRGESRSRSAFRESIDRELAWVTGHRRKLGAPLAAGLEQMLRRGLDNATQAEERALSREVRQVAEELLQADEGVRLIQHELAVALLRGRRRPEGPPEAPPVEVRVSDRRTLFAFSGEFWTDELDDLVVTLDDRCVE